MTTVFGALAQCTCWVLSRTYSGSVLSHTNYGPGTACTISVPVLPCTNYGHGAAHTNSGLVLSCTNSGPVLSHTNSGQVLPTPITASVLPKPILAWCYPHPFWPSAVRTLSGPLVQCSLHLSLPSAACTWLSEGNVCRQS